MDTLGHSSSLHSPQSRVRLLDSKDRVTLERVLALEAEGDIIACDFAIEGAVMWTAQPWGFAHGRVTNIDHHADVPAMQRHVSSTNLAIEWVEAKGAAPTSTCIVINHTDCESVLSSAIIAGELEPLPIFGAAAIAADHTGEANAIADLLQGLDSKRDYELSLRSLRTLLAGEPLEACAQEALDVRLQKRATVKRLVSEGAFAHHGGVYYADLPMAMDGELFLTHLPQAQILVLSSPHPSNSLARFVKVRLGLAAPAGFSLHTLDIKAFDPKYGGRWNAGSNKRGEVGTKLSASEYARQIAHCASDR